MKRVTGIVFMLMSFAVLQSQQVSFTLGTDIPYQHYVGVEWQKDNVKVPVRTGILVPPYSNMILTIIEQLGTDEIYIQMLESSYEFGWMNSIGLQFMLGEQRNWYLGAEFRIDNLTANDTRAELVEAVIGESLLNRWLNPEIKLGLTSYAAGIRLGREFVFGDTKNHGIRLEFSASKLIETESHLEINGNPADNLNQILDDLLWYDVFKPYGYVGGIGIAYVYRFN